MYNHAYNGCPNDDDDSDIESEPVTERCVYRIYYVTNRSAYATTHAPYPETFGSSGAAQAFIDANPGVFWGNDPQIKHT